MKKIFLAAAALALLGVSCSSSQTTAQKGTEPYQTAMFSSKPGVKIDLNMYTGDDEFIRLIIAEMKKAAEARGIGYDVTDSRNDVNMQISQAKNAAQTQSAGVYNLVYPDSDSAKTVTDAFKAKNVPVIYYNREPAESVIEGYDKAYYVGSISAQSGIMQGQLVVKHWQKNPNWDKNGDNVIQYVILKGRIGNPDAEERTKWVASTMAAFPNLGIKTEELAVEYGNWQREQARDKMAEWIKNGMADKIEVVICNNDAMALGAVEAMKAANVKIPVFGVDAVDEVLKQLNEGYIFGTVKQDLAAQAYEIVNLAANLANDKPVGLNAGSPMYNRHIMVPYIPVDKDNAAKYGG